MWRRPEDQHAKVLFDAVEPVLDSGRHEDNAPGQDGSILTSDLNGGASADHVIDLILEVRSLAISRPSLPDRQARAQLVRGQKVDVAMTFGISRLGVQLGNLECFHQHNNRRNPATNPASRLAEYGEASSGSI